MKFLTNFFKHYNFYNQNNLKNALRKMPDRIRDIQFRGREQHCGHSDPRADLQVPDRPSRHHEQDPG